MLTGKFNPKTKFSGDDHRSRMATFSGDIFLENLDKVELLKRLAKANGHSVNQLALRWILDYSNKICALFGAKTDMQIKENLGANGWCLTMKELEMVEMFINKIKE